VLYFFPPAVMRETVHGVECQTEKAILCSSETESTYEGTFVLFLKELTLNLSQS
jgi:hypothetical protein